MSVDETQDQKAIARPILCQGTLANTDASASRLPGGEIRSIESPGDCHPASTTENRLYEPGDRHSLPINRVDAANLIRVLRQPEVMAKRQAPRIAFKTKGRILFLNLAEIVAVHAEGNYVSLRHRLNPYLVHESLSSMAEKLKPYGFIRIHRSVVVNVSAVEEIRPLPTGEYSLRAQGGNEYLVTRTYKHNLRDLAQLWIGSERICG